MSEQLLCKDCKHSFRTIYDIVLMGWSSPYAYKCKKMFKDSAPEPNPVVGVKIKAAHYESCTLARMDYLSKTKQDTVCGPSGAWWQPKNKKDLFKLFTKECK